MSSYGALYGCQYHGGWRTWRRSVTIWVHSFRLPADTNATIKMEVGIEETACILSLSTTSPNIYHLKDVIVGKIYFLLVRIKIKHMELSIIRRETTGSPPNRYNESETTTKFEIMDGGPVWAKRYLSNSS
ncbi:vacuolar protein sorting-associated protein 26-domain-containing protein [Favolaschia claudopus]|uniref:Vacuolar protein sorting-associated protein 26-domain-containing protein n=1 Tax=Favolaschia claudopus TaxID=2862362 RepID=A0AAW0CPX2_9AGAR